MRKWYANVKDRCRSLGAAAQSGFTLIELLVVLAILGLMIAVVTPQVLKYLGRAKADTARIEMKNMETSLDMFMIDVGRYPTQQEGLEALVKNTDSAPGWNGPYLKTTHLPVDPWGHEYQYRIPGQQGDYDLYTLGPDNAPSSTIEAQATKR